MVKPKLLEEKRDLPTAAPKKAAIRPEINVYTLCLVVFSKIGQAA